MLDLLQVVSRGMIAGHSGLRAGCLLLLWLFALSSFDASVCAFFVGPFDTWQVPL